jgi:unsaturated chondroitin disaccharide hydrolase
MFDVVEKHFIREDGSTIEFIEFDPDTGEARKEFTILGYSDESCWSRGQAWAIAGSMFAYEHTRDLRFLRTCKKIFDYWWDNCGAELPPYDFKDPDAKTLPKDSSSSAIVTAALARLAVLKDIDSEALPLLERLDPMIEVMLAKTTPVDDNDQRPVGMLLDGCFNQPKLFANDHELLWGDFYLMETLYCLEKGGMPC